MVTLIAICAAVTACILSEWAHARRVRRVAHLAFGPAGRPRRWVRAAAPLRVVAVAALTWGLITLWQLDSAPEATGGSIDRSIHHVVVALDVSPSMHLVDAGPKGDQSRGDRAREVLRSILSRLDARRTRVSVVAFYSNARPVVVDTFDPDVTANVLEDLPLEHAFRGGKTNMYSGVKAAGELGAAWREGTATLLVVSDGDTLPPSEMPTLPPAFARAVVLGVGSPHRGTFIDGHSSRQDASSLERLALRLRGQYHDANTRHLPSEAIGTLAASLPMSDDKGPDVREAAIFAVAGSSV
ncbi:MAG: vWA domain-containing protein, partial [Pirellulales bacterium]